MIFDCFPFFNELELLELRLMELWDTVDYFVIAESNKTHSGNPKDFVLEKNKERYRKYFGNIIYVKVEDPPDYDPKDPYKIEHFQRNSLMKGLLGYAKQGDKILLSDLDEIPKPIAIASNLNRSEWLFLQEDLFYYYVNCQAAKSCGGTVMADYGTFESPQQLRRFAKIRYNFSPEKHKEVIPNSGWHYSYLGADPKKIRYKVENIAESKNLLDKLGGLKKILEKIKNKKDLFNRTVWHHKLKIVDIDSTKPKSMDKFLKKYPQFYYYET
jgi:beta-1,4-mannosyl-glycoprotein beta-1,4-N-acetylglucosaminyltransferase